MGDAEQLCERAAIGSDLLVDCSDNPRRQRRKCRVERPESIGIGEEAGLGKSSGITRLLLMYPLCGRIRGQDFDVGVSLSSPALESGTRTFSSG